ncbi:NAD-dependent protein deacetylase-like [Mytilus edulis]|uniref:NAD-dependent protein deacetylase-like n=1 Tax=Mytilus edulis TaxID=6550 RepID=UPI0039EFE27F
MASNGAQVKCSYINCDQRKVIDPESDRADVRGFHVSKSGRKGMLVDWTDDGSATLHLSCWQKISKAAKNEIPEIKLSDKEQELVKEAKKTAEFHDSEAQFQSEAVRIAEMLKNANYCIGFTGAGISTAAGIGDFRGIHGKWTNNDKTKDYGSKSASSGPGKQNQRGYRLPTYTHEAICKLLDMGIMKYLISQNTDGIHRLSGIPAQKISELHGNGFEEKCEKCETRRMRNTNTKSAAQKQKVPPRKCERCKINHRTGNMCQNPGCGGYMMNTIINFGDYLEGPVLRSAEDNAEKADLVLCLGTTLRVTPASDLVAMGKKPNRLIICNRQTTPYDDYCTETDKDGKLLGSRMYGDCDRLMRLVMRKILGEDAVKTWEDDRDQRVATYDLSRM